MEFNDTLKVASAAMSAQTVRLRTIAENLANSGTTGTDPGSDPYRRKLVTFKNELDRASGMSLVKVGSITRDASPFDLKYVPGHPAADANGYVRYPNVSSLIEMSDLRDAERSYQANVDVIDVVKTMLSRTIDLLR